MSPTTTALQRVPVRAYTPPMVPTPAPTQAPPAPAVPAPVSKRRMPAKAATATVSTQEAVAEVTRIIVDACQGDGWVPAAVAQEVLQRLRDEDPGLLQAFLEACAEQTLHKLILQHANSLRARNRRATGPAARFRTAAEAAEQGDTGSLRSFLQETYTASDGTRIRLGRMRRLDLQHAANDYSNRAAGLLMQEAFLRQLAEMVGDESTVEDLFDEEQLAFMWRSLTP